MGYFSSFAVDDPEIFPDHSVTPPEQQLLWRLDDLQNRLEELQSRGAPYSGGRVYMDDDLRYEPVGAFNRIMDVKAAIRLAVEDLQNKYGICVNSEEAEEAPCPDEPVFVPQIAA